MSLTHIPGSSLTVQQPDTFTDEKADREYFVSQDTDAEDPRKWIPDADVALWAYREPTMSSSVAAERPDNWIIDAFARFYEFFDDNKALETTKRWLRWFHPDTTVDITIQTIRGYSQSDWLDVVCVAGEGYGTAEGHIDEFRQWAYGDVWTVSTLDDALSGIYADDAEEAVKYYRAHHEPLADRLSEEKAAAFGRFVIGVMNGATWNADTVQAISDELRDAYGIELAEPDDAAETAAPGD